jgi:phage head maturation protease
MKKIRFSLLSCFVMLFAALALTGCLAKNNDVRLLYDTQVPQAVPAATAPRIVVVQFEDKRTNADLGVRKDGTAFQSSASVPGWVTQALADELAARGAQVSVALSMAQAQMNQPQYIVTGTVENVQLVEKSLTTCQAAIRLQTHLYSSTQSTVTRSFSSQFEKTGIPGAKLVEATLSGALAEALGNAATSVMGSLR